jgi:hypothetical protein
VPLAQWNIPPEQVNRLLLGDFAQLTDAIDAENRSRTQRAAQDGR